MPPEISARSLVKSLLASPDRILFTLDDFVSTKFAAGERPNSRNSDDVVHLRFADVSVVHGVSFSRSADRLSANSGIYSPFEMRVAPFAPLPCAGKRMIESLPCFSHAIQSEHEASDTVAGQY